MAKSKPKKTELENAIFSAAAGYAVMKRGNIRLAQPDIARRLAETADLLDERLQRRQLAKLGDDARNE